MTGATVTVATPAGWSAPSVAVPSLAPGATATVTVPLTADASTNGRIRLDAVLTTPDGRTSRGGFSATSQGAVVLGATVTGAAPARDLTTNPYAVGERLAYTLTVRSTSTVSVLSYPTASNLETNFSPPTAPNCRYLVFPAGAQYSCTPSHVLTQEDIDRGWFTPTATFTLSTLSGPQQSEVAELTAAPVLLRPAASIPASADITGARTDTGRDLATQPYTAGENLPYAFDVRSATPYSTWVVPTSGPFTPFLPAGPGNCRYRGLAAFAAYTCSTPQHLVTEDEVAAGFFVARTTWQVGPAEGPFQDFTVDGGEVDLKVREPALDGLVSPRWVDVDGDRYASAGDQVEVTRTLGNAGNVSLDHVAVDGAGIEQTALAVGASVSASQTVTITDADVAAGSLQLAGFSATARNGSLAVSQSTTPVTFALDTKPAQPTSEPTHERRDYDGLVSPVDIGLERKYRAGQKLTANGLAYGQWYFVYVNGTGQSLGWHFPTLEDKVELLLPEDVKNGTDTLVVLDSQGDEVAFDRFQVTPKGL